MTDLGGWHARMIFEPRDLWVGVFWKRTRPMGDDGRALREILHIYICVLPMMPLVLTRARWAS